MAPHLISVLYDLARFGQSLGVKLQPGPPSLRRGGRGAGRPGTGGGVRAHRRRDGARRRL